MNATASPRHDAVGRRDGLDIARRFAQAFETLDALYRSFARDGVLIAAIAASGEVAAYVHVAVDVAPTFAIVGRHPRCDLVLADDPAVSLRHAALSARRSGLDELELRLWDLDSGLGLVTEAGDRCEGLVTQGPLFVGVGRYVVCCLPTGALAPVPWGPTAADSWASLPERVLHDLRRPHRRAAGGAGAAADDRGTLMIPGPAVLRSRARLGPGAPAGGAGRLRLSTGGEALALIISDDELARGVLVGRDDRCGLTARLRGISRVHLLLVADAGGRWAIDTASTNGTTLRGAGIRQVRLDDHAELVLGERVTVQWSPGPRPP